MSETPGKTSKHKALDDLDLSHKRSRDRVRALLQVIEAKGKETWLRAELDDACGNRYQPLGKLLRSCFVQVGFYSPRANGWNEYVPNPKKVDVLREALVEADLREALVEADLRLQTLADEATRLEQDIEVGNEAHRAMFPHRRDQV